MVSSNHNTNTFLITGGTGKVGSRLAERLDRRGITTRIGSRWGCPPFEWADPSTWAASLAGCDAAFLAYAPDLGFPGAAEHIAGFADSARRSGVGRLVLLSGRGEPGAAEAEERLVEVAPFASIVRCAWFDQNFSESFLLDPVRDGVIALPVGDVAEPFIDADDIAEVALIDFRDFPFLLKVRDVRLSFRPEPGSVSEGQTVCVAVADSLREELASDGL